MPELTKLGQVLHEEHFHILVEVCGLESRVTGEGRKIPLDPDQVDDRIFLEELVHSLDGVIDHHVFEECVIFPLISDHDDSELAILLSREHGAIEPMARWLRTIAEAMLQDGMSPALWEAFCTAATDLTAEVLRHLQKEEQCIVQRLALLLDPETDSRLAQRLGPQRLDSFPAATDALAEPVGAADRGLGALPSRRAPVAAAASRAAARRRSTLPHQTAR
jgi:hemerythrin-like domain-containing protein